ncbi:glycerophosphodiester phosphodiesterase [Pseudoalteromonas sp.]|uniref:glycerophosphodiester phosphodiesterase n=1 Tax=Pseudoalteromonas sp. TaxID=53249 RepID=UPI003562838A
MKVFAHRGASGLYPENTRSAILAALELNVDGIEIDIQSTLDGFAVIHDTWLERTTNGLGKVNNLSTAELQQYDAGEGQTVPSLEQAIQWVHDRTLLNLELKNTFALDKFVKLIEQNVQCGFLSRENLLISSFDHHLLKWLKLHLPWVKIGALTSSIPLGYCEFIERLNAYSVHVDKNFVNDEYVADAKARNLKIFAYTVDKQEDIEDMLSLGIDGIFTNYPSKVQNFLLQKST